MENIDVIYIKNHFDFVDLYEKNNDQYKYIENIKSMIDITTEILDKKNETNYKTIKLLQNKLIKIKEIYEKIKNNLVK